MKPTDKLMAWKRETALDRVMGCMAMLYMHEFLTEAEQKRVAKRIRKWRLKHDPPRSL